ncbi:hypothetical protein A374_10470 [Fictibacillus macauensis ZFHKF-1]|uniref:Uncharacterized protein n=1 Tax=Fictibacillus macauensis ZFHKF-1 TaxID=1196324 RepID=I8UE26_9BACL|nr:hypothetical protein [Fictibacillus macauensis]EIT85160.1 hypothetical protein A374_10470 [Fictibacillus macauensis ZFHKF-1]
MNNKQWTLIVAFVWLGTIALGFANVIGTLPRHALFLSIFFVFMAVALLSSLIGLYILKRKKPKTT